MWVETVRTYREGIAPNTRVEQWRNMGHGSWGDGSRSLPTATPSIVTIV